MYAYIKQMQHEAAMEETIKLIAIMVIENRYHDLTLLRDVLGLNHINYCLGVMNSRINNKLEYKK